MSPRSLLAAGPLLTLLQISPSSAWSAPTNIEAPVVITLNLANRKWKVGDRLWYTLEFKNIGNESIWIGDDFWKEHLAQPDNPDYGTFFEVIGPKGKRLKPSVNWGGHGEFRFWGTDVSSFSMRVEPGESVFAAPSVVAPIRPKTGAVPTDFRAGPPGSPPGEYERLLRERFAAKNYPPCDGLEIPEARPPWAPANSRILEDYCLRKPGRYRIRAIYQPISKAAAAREMKSGRHWFGGMPESARIFWYASEWSSFEVSE